MRAAVHTRYGPPDVVRIEEVEEPVPRGNEVLVRVHATTVNRTDCGFRAARPFITRFFTGLRRPRVTIMGTEFAGVVEAVGAGVTAFKIGERVFGYSEGRFGCHAELLTVPVNGSIASIPANLTFVEVAPGTEGAHYALSVIRTAKIQHGQAVLVNGATGAIGSAAVQIIKGLGAQVTAVCDTAHLELVRGLGADRVIDYTTEDFTKDHQQYDVVLDAVGKSTFGRSPATVETRRVVSVLRPRSAMPEPRPRARHSAASWQDSQVPDSEGQPSDREAPEGTDRVGNLQAGHRQPLPTGPDRRGLPVRRDGAKDRQRRDRGRTAAITPTARSSPGQTARSLYVRSETGDLYDAPAMSTMSQIGRRQSHAHRTARPLPGLQVVLLV